MRDAFIERLSELAARDPRVFLITGDLGFGVITRFAEQFPKQFLNAGVAEQNMTGLATGIALEGRIVYTYSIANFPTLRCLEQIRNDAAYHEANVKVVAIGGGFSYGALGMSHHATEDLAILRAIPGITVVAPGDDWEAAEATEAVAGTPGTCYLRLDRSSAPVSQRAGESFALGRARMLRDGPDLTLITTGGMLGEVLAAAQLLDSQHIRCRVLSMHTLKPLDADAVLAAAADTGGIVTIEEHMAEGGLGSAVGEALLDGGGRPGVFHRIAVRGGFVSVVGSQSYLRAEHGLDAPSIARQVQRLLAGVPGVQS
jgi:transketolase